MDVQARSAPISTALWRPNSSSGSSSEHQAGDCSQAPAKTPLKCLADFQTWASHRLLKFWWVVTTHVLFISEAL